MNYGKAAQPPGFDRCNTAKAWRFQSTVAFSGSSRRTRLDFTSFLRFFLAMADVSDLKINEGAFVNPIIMHFQSLTNPQHMRMFAQTNPKSTGFS
jgi:hypothetical protein